MSKLYVFCDQGKKEIISRDGDFYFTSGERVPDDLRKGYQTTIFQKNWTPPFDSTQKAKTQQN
jgi:hypothetical protein